MIQRVQTIFLFLVAVSMIVMLFLPIWQKSDPATSEMLTMDAFNLYFVKVQEDGTRELIDTKPTYYISILAVITAIVALFSIFKYTNRMLQIKLGALISFLILILMMLTYYLFTKANSILLPNQQGEFLYGFYLPALALIFNFLANRFIRKDEKLVRSADRIR
jgi:glucan phosphoethanolaminetransferase (alkaline phosphatase superfamily)